jgi:hypothetical protein
MFANPAYHITVESNRRMLAAYRSKNWNDLEASLDALQKDLNALGVGMQDYITMYRQRLEDLRVSPPGPGWDGVFVSTKK